MDIKKRLEIKLGEIANNLLNSSLENKEIGVLGGISGNALFHFYYGRLKEDQRHIDKGSDIIYEIFQRIENGYSYPTFCDGIAGACWTLELLKEEEFIDIDEDIITEEVDLYLLEHMKKYIKSNDYDFLHGAIGIGFYFFKRYENALDNNSKKLYENYIVELIKAILENAVREDNIIKWKTEINVGDNKFEGYNLGLAHGIPSIINFLSRLSAKSLVFKNIIAENIDFACNFLIASKNKGSEYLASYPNWFLTNEMKSENSRLAWCYGDLGVGYTILYTACKGDNEVLEKFGIDVLNNTVKRKKLENSGVKDPGICHGAFGIMYIYHLLSLKTNNISFQEISQHWAEIALEMAIHNEGIAGFMELNDKNWLRNDNLISGASGIGLTILDYINQSNSKWRQALLL